MAWPGTGFLPIAPVADAGRPPASGGDPAPSDCPAGFMGLGAGGLFRRPCICEAEGLRGRPCWLLGDMGR